MSAISFKSGDLLRRVVDGKRGIYLKSDSDEKIFVQLVDKIVSSPPNEWTLMRAGWGADLKDEKERKAALKGT